MNSCIDFVMFTRRSDISSAEDIENSMSRRRWKRERPNEDEELANCLVLLSNSGNIANDNDGHYNKHGPHGHGKAKAVKKTKTGSVFQCKACKKVFASHQALGGHRASHKKVKGCFATEDKEEEEEEEEYKEEDDEDAEDEDEEEEDDDLGDKSTVQITRKRSNAHECTICHRIFSSGQALGGHKRCHWLTPSNYIRMSTSLHDTTDHHHHHQHHHNHHHHSSTKFEPSDHRPSLDLNLACQEYSVDRTALIGRSGNENTNTTQSSSSWLNLKLASGDWS